MSSSNATPARVMGAGRSVRVYCARYCTAVICTSSSVRMAGCHRRISSRICSFRRREGLNSKRTASDCAVELDDVPGFRAGRLLRFRRTGSDEYTNTPTAPSCSAEYSGLVGGWWPTLQLLMSKQHRTGDRLPLMTATLMLGLGRVGSIPPVWAYNPGNRDQGRKGSLAPGDALCQGHGAGQARASRPAPHLRQTVPEGGRGAGTRSSCSSAMPRSRRRSATWGRSRHWLMP
jgi:hypothetical protein